VRFPLPRGNKWAKLSGKQLPVSSIRIKKFCVITPSSDDQLVSCPFEASNTFNFIEQAWRNDVKRMEWISILFVSLQMQHADEVAKSALEWVCCAIPLRRGWSKR
jgi:hypothetical protein